MIHVVDFYHSNKSINNIRIRTYKIFVVVNKYDAIHDRDNVVKDIENVLKSLGIKRRDLENIVFAMDA